MQNVSEYMLVLALCLVVDISAKVIDENEVTPESDYVLVFESGACFWYPRYELSITQCSVDVTWFPFDNQTCHIEFESWVLDNSSLTLLKEKDPFDMETFLPPEGWILTGTRAFATCYRCTKFIVYQIGRVHTIHGP